MEISYCSAVDRLGEVLSAESYTLGMYQRAEAILARLARGEATVTELAAPFDVSLPAVSKHLRVLKDVGLVSVRRDGRNMFYRTNAEAIRPLHEWTRTFERFWQHQLNKIKELAERKTNEKTDSPTNFKPRSKNDLDRDKN